MELVQAAAEYFGLGLKPAREIIREVAETTRNWRSVAQEVSARRAEVTRMASAFEHEDLQTALQL